MDLNKIHIQDSVSMDKKRSQNKIPITFKYIIPSHANIYENEQVYLLAKNVTQFSIIFEPISKEVIKYIRKKSSIVNGTTHESKRHQISFSIPQKTNYPIAKFNSTCQKK